MKTITIDGGRFDNLESFYDEIQRLFCPGFVGFGRNLDAVNDLLHGGFGVFAYEEPIEIVWRDTDRSRLRLDHAALFRYLRGVREAAHASSHDQQNALIADAEAGQGPTLFDVIAEVVQGQNHITLMLR